LLSDGTTAIRNARAKHSTIAKLACLVEDLHRELACWADYDNKGLSADLCLEILHKGRVRPRSSELLRLTHELVEDGDQIRSCLAGSCTLVREMKEKVDVDVFLTSLSNSNHIVPQGDGREAVLLDRGGDLVAAKLYVAQHDRMQTRVGELRDGLNANWTLLEQLDLNNPNWVRRET
jgi:hypothetical protein